MNEHSASQSARSWVLTVPRRRQHRSTLVPSSNPSSHRSSPAHSKSGVLLPHVSLLTSWCCPGRLAPSLPPAFSRMTCKGYGLRSQRFGFHHYWVPSELHFPNLYNGENAPCLAGWLCGKQAGECVPMASWLHPNVPVLRFLGPLASASCYSSPPSAPHNVCRH